MAELERLQEIRKKRLSAAAWTLFSSIAVGQVLFASFGIGASFGPGPLKPMEALGGMAGVFLVCLAIALPMMRRRLERDASLSATLNEGRRRVRAVFFQDHFLLGPEIVLKSLVSSVELDKGALVLRYRDPRYDGAVLRELSGDPGVLERIASAIKPAGASA